MSDVVDDAAAGESSTLKRGGEELRQRFDWLGFPFLDQFQELNTQKKKKKKKKKKKSTQDDLKSLINRCLN